MKKLFLLIGLVVFLTPMVVSAIENDLLGYQCIEAIENIEATNNKYDGEWINQSTDTCSLNQYPQFSYLVNSSLFIKNNKVKFGGVISKLSGSRFDIQIPGSNKISGIIQGQNIEFQAQIKTGSTKKTAGSINCKLEFKKNTQYIAKQQSHKFCFYAKVTNSPYLKIDPVVCNSKSDQYKTISSMRQNECRFNDDYKKISYGEYIKLNNGIEINTMNKKKFLFRGEEKINSNQEYWISETIKKADIEKNLFFAINLAFELDRERNKEKNLELFRKHSHKNNIEELAIALGCGIKRDDVDDCVRRYLPSVVGKGPMTLEQIKSIAKDYELMAKIVRGIEEMTYAQNESSTQQQGSQQAQQQQNNSDFNLLNKNQMQFARPSDWGGHGQRIYQQSGWTSGIQPSDSGLR